MGHIKDLKQQRREALEDYQQALGQFPGFPVQHDHWNIIIDKDCIKQRIEEPFKGVEKSVNLTIEK